MPVAGADRGLVGAAVGYVLSAHLRADALERTPATAGAEFLASVLGRELQTSPVVVERAAVSLVGELAPHRRALTDKEWGRLLECAVVLARLEQFYRAGPAVAHHLRPLAQFEGEDLLVLTRALASTESIEDLDTLARATVEDHAGLAASERLWVGPSFAQSDALGGADADLICDGTLIDLRSTASPAIVGRREAWQLLGYALADTDDADAIRQASVAALRRRQAMAWPVQELADALAVGPSVQSPTGANSSRCA